MNETFKIKEELLSLYKQIKNDIPNDKLPTGRTKNIENSKEIDSLTLISYIKDTIPLLINNKISKISSNNNENNNNTQSELFNSVNRNEINKYYLQLENQLQKLENDSKYYLKYLLQYKIQKEILEMKLNAYMSLEDEYEKIKKKVKYEGGKFLDNDRKDNEIIILRSENSSLKKDIIKLEGINKSIENKNKEYQTRIQNLENSINVYKNKVNNLEKIIKDNNNFKQSLLQKDKNNSCVDLGIKFNDNTLEKLENTHKIYINNNYNIKNLKAFYPNSLNCKNKKMINFHSAKSDIIQIENNKNINNNSNNNIFCSTYSKIHKYNFKKNTFPIKNEFNNFKKIRNNSITIIKVEKDDNKSLSLNKPNERNTIDNLLYRTKNKIKTFNQILNSKQRTISPISCKSSGKLVKKYIHKEAYQNINANNNLLHKLRDYSSKH